MRYIKHLITLTVLIVFTNSKLLSQSLYVGSITEDYYRRAQLLGLADTNVSFTVRPIFPKLSTSQSLDPFYPEINPIKADLGNSQWQGQRERRTAFLVLPFSINTQYNSNHPYGFNDGAMIPAKGFQTLIGAGVYAKLGPLTIQLRPEFVAAENREFETFNDDQHIITFARYYDIYNNIDLPVRFGEKPHNRLSWGQSSIRLNFNALSVGVSTESLWWGPGINNSLLMSNNAPGFRHLTLNTLRPVKTPIGSFEAQLVGGRLNNSNFPPLIARKYYFERDLYFPKPDDERYLTGAILTWQPKWVPGLFLGINQVQQAYSKNLNNVGDYLPLFLPFSSASAPDNAINEKERMTSGFMRWLWPREHAEIYFEYGRSNNIKDRTQTFLSPNNSRAYTFGLRKLLPLSKQSGANVLIGIEVTQMQENSIDNVRAGKQWYVSNAIRQGYTNQGEVIGAGIGPGANMQSLSVSWVKGIKRIGLQLDRYVHNNDFYYYAFSDIKDTGRHWVDLSAALNGEWDYKKVIFNGRIIGTSALNYQWYNKIYNDLTFKNGRDVYNIQFQLGATYRF